MGHHNLSRESFANDFVPLNIERDFCQGHCIEDDVENSSYLKIQKSHFLLKKISKPLYWRNSLDHGFLDVMTIQSFKRGGMFKLLKRLANINTLKLII